MIGLFDFMLILGTVFIGFLPHGAIDPGGNSEIRATPHPCNCEILQVCTRADLQSP